MQVRRQEQRLGPGVQRRDDPGLGSQVLRIPQQGDERVVDTGKQQRHHHGDIAEPEVIELMGHGEDDMIMLAGQQPRFLLGQPPFALSPGTRGTHPVTTRVVPHAFEMALGTGLDVSTQQRGTTCTNRPHRTTHLLGQGMTTFIRRIAPLQNRLERELVSLQALSIAPSASF
jgi:hypothetical protein